MGPYTAEDAQFIRDFLTSPDFKRFCKIYFEHRTETLKSLCKTSYQSPTFATEMSHWQGVLVGMDKIFKILDEAQIQLEKIEQIKMRESEKAKDNKN